MISKVKSNSVVTYVADEDMVITFDVLGAGQVSFDPKAADVKMRQRAEVHGWIQRIVDAAAIGRDPQTGKSASAGRKLAAMKAVIDHYLSGTPVWRLGGTVAGGGNVSTLFRAIAEVLSIEASAVSDRIDLISNKRQIDRKEVLKLLRDSPGKVRDVYVRLRDEGAVDAGLADELLSYFVGQAK